MAKLQSKYELLPPDAWVFYKTHPIEFIENMVLSPHQKRRGKKLFLSKQQKDALTTFVNNRRLTIVSGRGCGKSAFQSLIAIWFVSVFEESKVILTAPSSKTLKSGLWKEIQKWLIGSHLEPMFEVTTEKIYVDTADVLKHENSYAPFIEMRTASANNAEALSGIHAENLLIEIDEASKVNSDNIRNLVNTLTGGWNNKIVMTSNGTRTTGEFYDSHMNDKSKLWEKFEWSAVDSPFTSEEQIKDQLLRYGEDSDIVRVDVYGKFAKEDPDSFMSFHEVCMAFDRDVIPEGSIEIGVDVARFGDDKTVLFWRHGLKVYEPIFKGKTSIPEVCDMVKELVTKIRIKTGSNERIRVKIDVGGLGAGVYDILELDRLHNIEPVACNFGGRGDERFQNEASAMWGSVRDVIDQMSLPDETECSNPTIVNALKEELSARRVRYDSGKTMIESKTEFKREFGRSPDFADALVLCFFNKKNARTFLPDFDTQSKDTILDKPSYLGGLEHYVSVHYSATRLASVVFAYWGGGTLYVFNESISDDNIARVASEMRARSAVKPIKILGNHRCFGNPSEDIRAQIRRQGIMLRENMRYDELGAIELLNYLVSNKSLKVVKNCNGTITQLDKWHVDLKPKDLDDNYGLCYAILNIVSELKDKIKPANKKVKEYQPYSSGNKSSGGLEAVHNGALLW